VKNLVKFRAKGAVGALRGRQNLMPLKIWEKGNGGWQQNLAKKGGSQDGAYTAQEQKVIRKSPGAGGSEVQGEDNRSQTGGRAKELKVEQRETSKLLKNRQMKNGEVLAVELHTGSAHAESHRSGNGIRGKRG